MKVYLSVPIITNFNPARANVMARAIVDSGNEVSSPWVLDPMERSSVTANVFERDRNGVESSDVIVADVSNPSTGVGMEIMAAHIKKRRVILVMKKGSFVTRMLLHMEPKEIIEFEAESDLYSGLRESLQNSEGRTTQDKSS